jgi:hypothetical protein
MTVKQPTLSDFEDKPPVKSRTYGEYINTKEGKVIADSHVRKFINSTLKNLKVAKLVKYERGRPGSLDYGRVVAMFAIPPSELAKEVNKVRNKKDKNTIWIVKSDFGRMTRAVGQVHYPIMVYKSSAVAEKKYKDELYYFLGKGAKW